MDLEPQLSRRRTQIGVAFVAIQWVLLTITLGVMIIYTDRSLQGLIGLHLNSGYAFFGATLIGFLMGATVERSKALLPMVALSCACAAGIYASLLFFPVWTGKLVHTVGLENFATTRAVLYFGISMVPMSLGAIAGKIVGTTLPGGDLLTRGSRREHPEWWLDRTRVDERSSETVESR